MTRPDPAYDIQSPEALQALFGPVAAPSLMKELDHLSAGYQALIRASPFFALATSGADGLDCSPRGDPQGFVEVLDAHTLLLPERRGNNRIDSLRNLLEDPRVALLFLVPGVAETLRVNGRARLSTDPSLLARHAVSGREPKLVLVVEVQRAYFQCSRAVVRADLWNPAKHVPRSELPSTGALLAEAGRSADFDAEAYDAALPARVRDTLY
jgi:uncharacterized protein